MIVLYVTVQLVSKYNHNCLYCIVCFLHLQICTKRNILISIFIFISVNFHNMYLVSLVSVVSLVSLGVFGVSGLSGCLWLSLGVSGCLWVSGLPLALPSHPRGCPSGRHGSHPAPRATWGLKDG